MDKKLAALLIIGLLLISGCSQNSVEPFTEQQTPDKIVQETRKCPDGTCDDFEKANSACPEDCGEIRKTDTHTKQQQPPPECIGRAETEQNLPQSCKNWFRIAEEKPKEQQPLTGQQEDAVTSEATGTAYKTVSSKPSAGWFKTGQDADIMLSGIGFNNAGGALNFNHLGVPGSDGIRLAIPDRFNNRVLIWNRLPAENKEPDLVLGQKDFITNNPGTGPDQMNWPVSVSVSEDGKLAVADTMNARILLWNMFPTKNGQPADVILHGRQGSSQQKTDIAWPWGVWTDGEKLAVTSTRGPAVLIWNQFPTRNDQKADIYLTAKNQLGTPRTITSDGKRLIVSDHNAKVSIEGKPALEGGTSATFFWKSFPTTNDAPYDFYMKDWLQGTITKQGKLLLLGDKLYTWNSFPQSAEDKPDLSVGRTGPGGQGFYFEGGDGAGIAEASDGKIYISLYNGNRVVVYNAMPKAEEQKPDFAIGANDIETNTLKTNFFITNAQPATDGKSLFAVSDFDRKLYVWKSLPDESGAKPDFVYDFFGRNGNVNFQATGIATGQNALAIAGRGPNERADIYIWTKTPLNGELPDRHFTGRIGDIAIQKAGGVAIDEKYFYISDEQAGRIYVWEGVPKETDSPKITIPTESPTTISSDEKYLAVNSIGVNPVISIYDVSTLSSGSKPRIATGVTKNSGRAYVSKGHLFTASTGNSQIRVWKDIEKAISGANPDAILGEDDMQDEVAEIGRNKLFWPMSLAFDGSYLWVGEVKFSNRLVRFSIKE